MKSFMLLLVFVSACSSWKQKDFKKSLEKPIATEAPDVAVKEKDKELLEKFEVKEVSEVPVVQPPVAQKKAPVRKVGPVKPVTGPVGLTKTAPPVAPVSAVPKDYPEELIAVNAKAQKVWEQFKPNIRVGDKTYLDIHYLGMTVGKIVIQNKGKQIINGKEVWHLSARFKSAPFYSNIYELDNTVDTHVSTDKFLSAKYTLIQRESKQSVDDVQLFDREALKTFWFYKQKKSDGKVKNKDAKKSIPFYSIDPFSVVFLFQGLPLKQGDAYQIPIINKGKILLLNAAVEGRETIDTEVGEKKAVRVHATTKYTGDHLKSGELFFWFSDDQERRLLKASAKIKIGSVTADIVKD